MRPRSEPRRRCARWCGWTRKGDTTTLGGALCEAGKAVTEPAGREAERHPDSAPPVKLKSIERMAAVGGYRSSAVGEGGKDREGRRLPSTGFSRISYPCRRRSQPVP